MLLAAAGQAAPYTYESSAARKINNNNNNSSNSSSSKNNVSSGNSTSTPTTGAAAAAATTCNTSNSSNSIASNAATAFMKTLSVRLHRGTEFIKDTVQKALVMSATTPVIAAPPQAPPKQPDTSHKLKRKVYGTGGIMGTSAETSLASRQFVRSQPYIKPTPAFLRHFAVAPSALHRSASARKRNPSTDSLLMDMCLFKPIRPMPITPIKINKARGFELKRPKFMPPASNLYSEDEDEDDDDEEEDEGDEEHGQEVVGKEREAPKEPVALKPKLSTLTLPQNVTASAFVLHEAGSSSSNTQTKDNSNTHTSGSGSTAVAEIVAEADAVAVAATDSTGRDSAKPKKVATKRRRRAPLLTARRRRKTSSAATAKAKESATKTAATTAAAPKRKRLPAAAATVSTTISPVLHSPPMTRQRARLQISTSK
ncbi:uncharacterized protein LOC6567445 [Drosophila grimshawi]|uniref:GH17407 n=1 Tax=Drosophila grimshawi TaxID=7222 RepID=B4JSV4_DROGR|nr:uncharacterized protein LOC6567445 [Drosophila grimshawi]XP_032596104.1 uncharacterized protein LOC6567445 [Drosophila grimshawi]EDV94844.1 GH17407 [Drosophila grimshawi]